MEGSKRLAGKLQVMILQMIMPTASIEAFQTMARVLPPDGNIHSYLFLVAEIVTTSSNVQITVQSEQNSFSKVTFIGRLSLTLG
jgi:hypothetical protein